MNSVLEFFSVLLAKLVEWIFILQFEECSGERFILGLEELVIFGLELLSYCDQFALVPTLQVWVCNLFIRNYLMHMQPLNRVLCSKS